MTNQKHEISAIHEAGHMVYIEQFFPVPTGLFPLPLETLPPRTMEIEIWYDEEKERYEDWTVYSEKGLLKAIAYANAIHSRNWPIGKRLVAKKNLHIGLIAVKQDVKKNITVAATHARGKTDATR